MSLNNLKQTKTQDIDWLEISCCMTKLSKSLRTSSKEDIKHSLIFLIYQNMILAQEFNINMDEAWNKWSKKAISKIYY